MMDMKNRFLNLERTAADPSVLADGTKRSCLVRDVATLHREIHEKIRQLRGAHEAQRQSVCDGVQKSLGSEWMRVDTWKTGELEQVILGAGQATSGTEETRFRELTDALRPDGIVEIVARLSASARILRRAAALGGILLRLPLENAAYMAELETVLKLDVTARKTVNQQNEETT